MTAADSGPPAPRVRWKWFPPTVAAIAVVLVGVLWLLDPPRDRAFWFNVGIAGLAGFLLLGWVAIFSGLRRSLRLTVFSTPCVLVAAFFALFRLDCDGDTVPYRVSLRGTQKPHERLETPRNKNPENPVLVTPHPRDYPQFQGELRDGQVRGVKLARNWAASPPRKLWRQPIGAGWAGFSVVGDYAFTQEQRGELEMVTCYELKTGKLVWAHLDEQGFVSQMGGDGPRATPTVHDGLVYAMGAMGMLNCLDAATGELKWGRDVLKEHEAAVTTWGKACSPLIVGDLVIVTGGGGKGPSLLAFERHTGQPRWSGAWDEDGGTIADSYASPVLATIAGVEQIVNLEDKGVASYDFSGRQLWKFDWPFPGLESAHPKVSQPVILPGDGFDGGYVLITSGYTSGSSLYKIQRETVDKRTSGAFTATQIWSNIQMKTKFCNVVVQGDSMYGLDAGILACVNWRSGKQQWKQGRYGHGQILLVDDVILVQTENGPVALVEANPKEFVELGSFDALNDRTWNTMALAGAYLVVRNDREAACYELPVVER